MVKGYIGLNDRVKVTKRGAKGTGKIVKVGTGTDVTVQYDNGEEVTVNAGDVSKTRK